MCPGVSTWKGGHPRTTCICLEQDHSLAPNVQSNNMQCASTPFNDRVSPDYTEVADGMSLCICDPSGKAIRGQWIPLSFHPTATVGGMQLYIGKVNRAIERKSTGKQITLWTRHNVPGNKSQCPWCADQLFRVQGHSGLHVNNSMTIQ